MTPTHLAVGAVMPWSDLTTDELDAELRAIYKLIRAQCVIGAHVGYDKLPTDQILAIIDAAAASPGDGGVRAMPTISPRSPARRSSPRSP